MKRLYSLLAVIASLCLLSCGSDVEKEAAPKEVIRVAVFQGHGGSETCVWEAKAAVEMDPSLECRLLTTKEINEGALADVDVLVVPGGGGSRQYLNMGGEGRRKVQEFVANGGGYVGICAGAYLITETPNYACLAMSGAEAHDIEHDNRGRGIAKVTLTDEGKKLFPEVAEQDTLYIMYYEGPVVLPREGSEVAYHSYATMESDVHVEGNAPSDMTKGKSFLYIAQYGKGWTASVVGHPEATPGMQWMLSRLVHKVSPRQMASELPAKFIDPSKFGKELLMTEERRQAEGEAFQTFLYGDEEAKLAAINWLMQHNSWDAKRWIQGLIFDASPAVRKRVAEWISWAMYRTYLPDLEVAYNVESEPEVKQAIGNAVEQLKVE